MTELLPKTREAIDEAVNDIESYVAAADERLAKALGRKDHKMEDFFRREVAHLKVEVARLKDDIDRRLPA
jgi:hypothetical protein